MPSLAATVNTQRVLNNGIVVKHVYEMLDFTEEFKHILEYKQPYRPDMDALEYITLLHDDLLEHFIQVEDLDKSGTVKEKIKNFSFSVDSTEE